MKHKLRNIKIQTEGHDRNVKQIKHKSKSVKKNQKIRTIINRVTFQLSKVYLQKLMTNV